MNKRRLEYGAVNKINANTNEFYDCVIKCKANANGCWLFHQRGVGTFFGVCNKIIHLLSSLEEIIRCIML